MTHPSSLPPTAGPLGMTAFVNLLNPWLTALKTSWSGTGEPPSLLDGLLWYDSNEAGGPRLRLRSGAAWIDLWSDIGTNLDDCDTALVDGRYGIVEVTANSPFAGKNGSMIVSARASRVTQLAFCQSVSQSDLFWMRTSVAADGSSWQPWCRVFTQADIVGPVAMSGGIPSGAIIQSESLATGRYIRFADGTQICWTRLTLTYASAAILDRTWIFPAPFSGTGYRVFHTLEDKTAAPTFSELGQIRIDNLLATELTLELYRQSGKTDFASGNTALVHVGAIGIWTT